VIVIRHWSPWKAECDECERRSLVDPVRQLSETTRHGVRLNAVQVTSASESSDKHLQYRCAEDLRKGDVGLRFAIERLRWR
jgi:hypothetical protein